MWDYGLALCTVFKCLKPWKLAGVEQEKVQASHTFKLRFLMMVLAPFAALVAVYLSLAGFWTFVIAALLAWGFKSAVIDPIAMSALMQVYFKAIEGQDPQREWEQKLEHLSDKFRTLKEKGRSLNTFNPFETAAG